MLSEGRKSYKSNSLKNYKRLIFIKNERLFFKKEYEENIY